VNRDLRGSAVYRCESCGLAMDRQLNAAIDLYLRMEGVSPAARVVGWKRPAIAGGRVPPDGGGAEGTR